MCFLVFRGRLGGWRVLGRSDPLWALEGRFIYLFGLPTLQIFQKCCLKRAAKSNTYKGKTKF